MAGKRRDVGGVACGGLFVVAGGTDGKSVYDTVDYFIANGTATGGGTTVHTGVALRSPTLECLGGRYVKECPKC